MLKCVIFDLDDTLYDEIDYCRSGFGFISAYISTDRGVNKDKFFSEIWVNFTSGNREMLFNKILDEFNITYDADYIKKLVSLYRGHRPDITLSDQNKKVLDLLRNDYTLALLSDGFMPAQRLKVESLGIKEYFEEMIFTEEIGREFWKPSTVSYERLLAKLDFRPKEAVYVADNLAKDFIAPNKLGMASVQLVRDTKIHKDIQVEEIARPGFKINNLFELPELLKKL